MPAQRIAGLLLFLLTAGCVGIEDAPTREPLRSTGAQPAPDSLPKVPASPAPTEPLRSNGTQPAPRSLSKVPVPPAPTEPLQQKAPAAPSPGKPEVSPTLDLVSLEKRLRESDAIGIFTKISLKNQVGDLVDQFRAFHQGRGGTAIPELRERYNLLLLKVLSLLQDGDPLLARAIAASREPIWNLLADPAKFATL